MRITVKGRRLTTEHIWFEQFDDKRQIESHADRVTVHANNVRLTNADVKQFSLISDLQCDTDKIFDLFSSTVRNEIRRAEREGAVCREYGSRDIIADADILVGFSEMYAEMYKQKGMVRALPINEINAYAENGCFLLTAAEINGKICVYHSYIVGEGMARLLHSCSEFRVADNAERNAIGRANKLLHFCDMKYLKALGVLRYDWGGVSSIEQPNGIDKFKMSFGGEPTEYYNGAIERSPIAKTVALYRKIFKKREARH